MIQDKKKKIGLVAVVIIVTLLFTTGTLGFIAVQNVDPAPVITGTISVSAYEVNLEQSTTWSWNIGSPVDPAFDDATVKGTMAFSVVMTGDPVDSVKLDVEGVSAGASPGGMFVFTEGANGWTLAFDTTVLLDGEYVFTLSYLIVDDGGGDGGGQDVPMSSFGFLIDDEEVVIDLDDNMMIIVVGLVVVTGFLIILKKRREQ